MFYLLLKTIADCMSKDVDFLITNRGKIEDYNTNNKSTDSPLAIDPSRPKTSPTALHFSRGGAINRTQQILGNASKVFSLNN